MTPPLVLVKNHAGCGARPGSAGWNMPTLPWPMARPIGPGSASGGMGPTSSVKSVSVASRTRSGIRRLVFTTTAQTLSGFWPKPLPMMLMMAPVWRIFVLIDVITGAAVPPGGGMHSSTETLPPTSLQPQSGLAVRVILPVWRSALHTMG